jgi:hypothetical protein
MEEKVASVCAAASLFLTRFSSCSMADDGVVRITTAVRIRPLSSNEEAKGARIIASTDANSGEIVLLNPVFFESSNQTEKLRKLEERRYACDFPLWSVDSTHPDFMGQEDVYTQVGKPIVTSVLEGLNCSLFAYGTLSIFFRGSFYNSK